MCELRFSKELFKDKLQYLLNQDKYSKSDLIEQLICLLSDKSKSELIQALLSLSSNEELEELMEKIKLVDATYKIN